MPTFDAVQCANNAICIFLGFCQCFGVAWWGVDMKERREGGREGEREEGRRGERRESLNLHSRMDQL